LIEFFVDHHACHWHDGAKSRGVPGADEAQDAPEDADPQGSPTATTGGDGVPAPDTTTTAEAMASLATSGPATGDPAVSIGLTAGALPSPPCMATATTSMGADDNVVEEPEVIMGHLSLMALGTVSLSEVM
jgi:hypothetical protein